MKVLILPGPENIHTKNVGRIILCRISKSRATLFLKGMYKNIGKSHECDAFERDLREIKSRWNIYTQKESGGTEVSRIIHPLDLASHKTILIAFNNSLTRMMKLS